MRCEICGGFRYCNERIHALAERVAKLEAALREVLSAMSMQENRETGAFHLSQPAAAHIWNGAKDKAEDALKPDPTAPTIPDGFALAPGWTIAPAGWGCHRCDYVNGRPAHDAVVRSESGFGICVDGAREAYALVPAEPSGTRGCVCREPSDTGVVHRRDGPCYVTAPQPEAPCDECHHVPPHSLACSRSDAAKAMREMADALDDKKPRDPGCQCDKEEGDSPCRVHGDDEPAEPPSDAGRWTAEEIERAKAAAESYRDVFPDTPSERPAPDVATCFCANGPMEGRVPRICDDCKRPYPNLDEPPAPSEPAKVESGESMTFPEATAYRRYLAGEISREEYAKTGGPSEQATASAGDDDCCKCVPELEDEIADLSAKLAAAEKERERIRAALGAEESARQRIEEGADARVADMEARLADLAGWRNQCACHERTIERLTDKLAAAEKALYNDVKAAILNGDARVAAERERVNYWMSEWRRWNVDAAERDEAIASGTPAPTVKP